MSIYDYSNMKLSHFSPPPKKGAPTAPLAHLDSREHDGGRRDLRRGRGIFVGSFGSPTFIGKTS